jgi:hypothetical protein
MKYSYIAKGGVLLGAEGAFYTQAAQQGVAMEAAEAVPKQPQRAPCKCSMCYLTGHTAYTCPKQQATS